MADNTENQELIEQAQELTNEYVELLEEWIPKRLETAAIIREIASELRTVTQGVNIFRVIGSAVGVVGGVAAVAGTTMTGGLADPFFIGGLVTVLAGTTTSAGARIAEHFISKSKLESAQELWEDDEKLTKNIEKKRAKLNLKVEELKNLYRRSTEEVLTSILSNRGRGNLSELMESNMLVAAPEMLVCMLRSSFQSGSVIGKGMGAVAEVSLKGFSKVLGTGLRGVASGAILSMDIFSLVVNSIELANGSPSGAADSLTKFATELEEQADDLETVLD